HWYLKSSLCATHMSNNGIKNGISEKMEGDCELTLNQVVVFLSLSIPILDCHHTWYCCGIPSDFYCAMQN
ncbi:hypothetical protein STEG23_024476, partial [Scotinomys teguina]